MYPNSYRLRLSKILCFSCRNDLPIMIYRVTQVLIHLHMQRLGMTHSLRRGTGTRNTRCLQLTFVSDLHHNYCVNGMNKQIVKYKSKGWTRMQMKTRCLWVRGRYICIYIYRIYTVYICIYEDWDELGVKLKDQHIHQQIHGIHRSQCLCHSIQKKPNSNSQLQTGPHFFVWLSQTFTTQTIIYKQLFRHFYSIYLSINFDNSWLSIKSRYCMKTYNKWILEILYLWPHFVRYICTRSVPICNQYLDQKNI